MAKGLLPLIRIATPKDSRLHLVNRDKFVIGRAPDVDIQMLSPSVSRKHLSVEIRGGDIFIEDLGSSNGSFLNDVKLEPGKKYPISEKTTVRLGTSNEAVSFELMEKPTEFRDFDSFLGDFNSEFQAIMEKIIKDATLKAEKILQESQLRAANLIHEAKAQEETALAAVNSKTSSLLKEASAQAQKLIENAQRLAEEEAKNLREKAQREIEEESKQKLDKIREEAALLHKNAVDSARLAAHQELEAKKEQAAGSVREHLAQLKAESQMEADQILQNAHKEANRIKENSVAEIEKFRLDIQKRSDSLLAEAETEAASILQSARETAEKMRQTARQDLDETLEKSQAQSKELLANAEREANHTLEIAKKKAQALVETQEAESRVLMQNIRSEIEKEAKLEADKLLLEHRDQIEKEKNQLKNEIQATLLKRTEIESEISRLEKDQRELLALKEQSQAEVQGLQAEVAKLKDENSRQSALHERLAQLEGQLKALDFQRAQALEKNEQTEQELNLLKKRTFEELERVRLEEEQKVLQVAALKAKEFSQRIEKVVLAGVNEKIVQKLTATQLNEISLQVSEELTTLFAAESFKHSEKTSLQKSQDSVGPKLVKTKKFKWGVAAAAVAAGFFLVKNSEEAVKMQDRFTETLIEKQRDEAEYKPTLTTQYRSTYTDNVLYMERYVDIKTDEKAQDLWALNLNEFFLQELKLSEENMVRFIGIESAMVKKLSTLRNSIDSRFLEEGIQRMREVEIEEVAKIQELLVTPVNYERLRLREKGFLAQLPVTLRDPAQEPSLAPVEPLQQSEISVATPPEALPKKLPAKKNRRTR